MVVSAFNRRLSVVVDLETFCLLFQIGRLHYGVVAATSNHCVRWFWREV